MNDVSRPDLIKLSQRLAGDSARVEKFLDGLQWRVDKLVTATEEDDWREVRRLSEFLAHSGQVYGYPAISEQARHVCQNIERPESRAAAMQGLVRLIGMCGRVKSPADSSRAPS
jgi:hypothetical protein